eukprot:2047597-Rhodomonas_salina.2
MGYRIADGKDDRSSSTSRCRELIQRSRRHTEVACARSVQGINEPVRRQILPNDTSVPLYHVTDSGMCYISTAHRIANAWADTCAVRKPLYNPTWQRHSHISTEHHTWSRSSTEHSIAKL